MTLPALVLVHGGGSAADSWELTIEELHQSAPELTVLTLDTPGWQNKPGDLRLMTIVDMSTSLVGDIESAGVERHRHRWSFDGRYARCPGAVTKLGAARVREMIFAACLPSARRHVHCGRVHRG